MKPKHTPGPWGIRIRAVEGFHTAYVNLEDNDNHDEHRANAALIASAPEMLHALKTLLEKLWEAGEIPNGCAGAVAIAAQSVAKAEGRTK